MARIAIDMPVLGVGQDTGRVAGWLKRVGDRVERGDAVAEIETEKVNVEIEAEVAGTLVVIVPVDTEVAVGDPVAWLDDQG